MIENLKSVFDTSYVFVKERSLSSYNKEAIGKYESNEVMSFVETAKKIADVFEVTLDYLVDDSATPTFDKQTVKRLQDIQILKEDDKKHLFAMMDAFITKKKIQAIL